MVEFSPKVLRSIEAFNCMNTLHSLTEELNTNAAMAISMENQGIDVSDPKTVGLFYKAVLSVSCLMDEVIHLMQDQNLCGEDELDKYLAANPDLQAETHEAIQSLHTPTLDRLELFVTESVEEKANRRDAEREAAGESDPFEALVKLLRGN